MATALLPTPSDEQAMLLDASARFMEATHPLAAVRAVADGAPRDDVAYRTAAAELGWFGLLVDEAHGGGSMSGNGLLDAALLATERGTRLQPGPYAEHLAVTAVLAAAGRADDARPLAAGEGWATWVDAPQVEVRSAGSGELTLTGTTGPVLEAAACSRVLLRVSGPDGAILVLVPIDRAGVATRPLTGLDVTRTWAALELDDVALAPADLVGLAGHAGAPLHAHLAQITAVLVAAEAVGAASAVFDLALDYAKERVAFGRPIGSFQGLKHLIADASLWVEMSKALVTEAATVLGSGSEQGGELAHAARAFVAERGPEVAQTCFQVFGGIGFTWEHDQHLFLRRISADAVRHGTAAHHRDQMLESMGALR